MTTVEAAAAAAPAAGAAAWTEKEGQTGSGGGPELFQCEKLCGFTGEYGAVETHEETCAFDKITRREQGDLDPTAPPPRQQWQHCWR